MSVVTDSPQEVITLVLRVRPPQEPQEHLKDLVKILEKYGLWKDPLSKKLFQWGAKAINDLSTIKGEEALQKFAKEKIDLLRQKILISPLDGTPLKKTVLERKWPWEEEELDRYRALSYLSPFDRQPMEEAKPHGFANELSAWAESFFGQTRKEESDKKESKILSTIDPKSKELSQQEQMQIHSYIKTTVERAQRALAALTLEEQQRQTELMRNERRQLSLFKQQMTVATNAKVEEEKLRAAQREKTLKEGLNNYQETTQNTIDIYKNRSKETDKKNEFLEQQAKHQSSELSQLKGQIGYLNSKVSECNSQLDRLRNEKSDSCVIL